MKLERGMTRRLQKRIKGSSSESNGKKPSWIEYTPDVGLTKKIGEKGIVNNTGNVGKVNKRVAQVRGTF